MVHSVDLFTGWRSSRPLFSVFLARCICLCLSAIFVYLTWMKKG